MRSTGRLALELIGFTLLTLCVLLLVLGAGQAAKVANLLAGGAGDWPRALSLAALILLEVLLPLAGLLAAGLTYGRQRGEGALLARATLGEPPWLTYAPALLLGLALGLGAATLARRPVPEAVQALRALLVDAAVRGLTRAAAAVALPGGGVVRAVTAPDRDAAALWAVVPLGEGPPALLHAGAATARWDAGQLELRLEEAWLWGGALRVRAGQAGIALDDAALARQLGSFGPPNATPSPDLGLDPHARFTWHRRLALPAMAPLWALLGALLGAALGGTRAMIIAAAAVAGAWWLLRTGELTARAGLLSPALAAWAPALLLLLAIALVAGRLSRRVG